MRKEIYIYSVFSSCCKLPYICSLMIPSKFLKMVICHPVTSFVTQNSSLEASSNKLITTQDPSLPCACYYTQLSSVSLHLHIFNGPVVLGCAMRLAQLMSGEIFRLPQTLTVPSHVLFIFLEYPKHRRIERIRDILWNCKMKSAHFAGFWLGNCT